MNRCTACRANLGGATLCPRCGCDFTLADQAEKQAQRLVGLAIRAWIEGNKAVAATRIGEARSARNGRLAEALAEMLRRGRLSSDFLAAQTNSPRPFDE